MGEIALLIARAMNKADLDVEQKTVCERFNAPFYGCDLSLKVGVSKSIRSGERPINALRIHPNLRPAVGISGQAKAGPMLMIFLCRFTVIT